MHIYEFLDWESYETKQNKTKVYYFKHTHLLTAQHAQLDKNAQAKLTQLKEEFQKIEKAKKSQGVVLSGYVIK